MRSRGRVFAEGALRALAFVALAALVWHAFHPLRSAPAADANGTEVDSALVRWTTREAPGRVHVKLDAPASAQTRDWLRALRRAGTAVSWAGAAPPPSALVVEPVADPRRPSRVWLAAPPATHVALRDAFGFVDSATIARHGARVLVPNLAGTLHATAPDFQATSAPRDSLVLRPLLVLGQASWEAKFTIAALEEHGWEVEARIAVAPSGDARQGAERVVAIDTSRYAAVIAIDSVAARYARQIIGYVRAGGGLIAVGEGAALSSLAPVLPASVEAPPSRPGVFTAETARTAPRAALALAPLGRLEEGAVPLETRNPPPGQAQIAAAAWRAGAGRVLQIGYHDIWRWRVAGGNGDPVRAHRAWWAALVSSVAYAPRVPLQVVDHIEPTPLATLVATLGPPAPPPSTRATLLYDPRLVPALFALFLFALLLEWLSRRLRGSR